MGTTFEDRVCRHINKASGEKTLWKIKLHVVGVGLIEIMRENNRCEVWYVLKNWKCLVRWGRT